jgi:hypothetical protein
LVTLPVPFGKGIAILKNRIKDKDWTAENSKVIRMLTRLFAGKECVRTLFMPSSRCRVVDVDSLLDSKTPEFCGDDRGPVSHCM